MLFRSLAALRRLVLGAVQRHGLGVGEEDVVRHDVGLAAGVAGGAGPGDERRAPAGGVGAGAVPHGRVRPGLVESGPELDAVAELAEAHLREVHVVLAAQHSERSNVVSKVFFFFFGHKKQLPVDTCHSKVDDT